MLYFQTELMVERLSGDSMSLGAIPFFYMICHGIIPGIAGWTSGRMQQKWCAANALSGYFADEPPRFRASAQHVRKCVSAACQEMRRRYPRDLGHRLRRILLRRCRNPRTFQCLPMVSYLRMTRYPRNPLRRVRFRFRKAAYCRGARAEAVVAAVVVF